MTIYYKSRQRQSKVSLELVDQLLAALLRFRFGLSLPILSTDSVYQRVRFPSIFPSWWTLFPARGIIHAAMLMPFKFKYQNKLDSTAHNFACRSSLGLWIIRPWRFKVVSSDWVFFFFFFLQNCYMKMVVLWRAKLLWWENKCSFSIFLFIVVCHPSLKPNLFTKIILFFVKSRNDNE